MAGPSAPFDLRAVWDTTLARFPYLAPAEPFKNDGLYQLYREYFPQLGVIGTLVELGIYRGGSMVLWREALKCRVIGIDLDPPAPTMPLLSRYIAESGATGEIALFWRTDQADEYALRRIIGAHARGPLDVVIDDASHLYVPTRTSFEVLFPLLRPGGTYF